MCQEGVGSWEAWGCRRRALLRFIATSSLALIIPACGGGGGNGGGGGASSGLPTTLGYAVEPQTQEDRNSENSLGPINAFVPIIHDNVLGTGETVAIFDTGVDASHPDLSGQILTTEGYDEGTDTQTTINTDPDSDTHGTAVASIIAALRNGTGIEGVAPGAKVLPVELPEDAQGDFADIDDAHLAPAVSYVAGLGTVHVINNSWNISGIGGAGLSISQYELTYGHTLASDFPNTVTAWQNFVNAGNVVVWAAGNEGASQPDAFAGLPQEISGLKPGWAVAVAINANGSLASFSNACGITASYCIASTGVNVTVAVGPSVSGTGYAVYSGTSFAAPSVSAAIALLMSAAPSLTAQQALQILFETANKSGAFADAAIYGEGVMDLNQAMQPVGQVVVSAASVRPASLTSTTIALGGAFGAGPTRELAATPMTVLDSFDRGYSLSMGSRFVPVGGAFDAFDRLGAFAQPNETVMDDGFTRVDLVSDPNPQRSAPEGSQSHFIAEERLASETALRYGAGIDPGLALGSGRDGAAGALAQGLLAPGSVSNPYLSLIDKSVVAALDLPLAGGKLTVASASGEAFNAGGLISNPFVEAPHIVAGDIEQSWRIGNGNAIRVDAGSMVETGSLLGTLGSGAAEIGPSDTVFAGLGGEMALGRDSALVGGIHAGLSSESGAAGSMIRGAADIGSFAAGLGLVERDALSTGDRFTLAAGLPLRAVSGHADILVPNGVNLDGTVNVQPTNVGMRADGREVDLQGAWSTPLERGIELTTALLVRQEPDNVRSASPEAMAALRLDVRF